MWWKIIYPLVVFVSESEPVCRTNISLADNTVDMSDDIEIECSVRYRGIWTPVFMCADHLPGTTINQTSSDHVLYTRLIAASNIQQFTQLSCSMTFTLSTHYQSISPDISVQPEPPVSDFVWKTSSIRVFYPTGEYWEINISCFYTVSHATIASDLCGCKYLEDR